MEARLPRKALAVILLAAAAIPPALIAWRLVRSSVDIPLVDEWDLVVRLVQARLDGRLGLELWSQHNEHRILVPRLIVLPLVLATGWDLRYEVAANFLASVGIFGALVGLLRSSLRAVLPRSLPWLVLVASLAAFSLAQFQNWVYGGLQLAVLLNVAAAAVAAWGVAAWGPGWRGTTVWLVAALVGTLSFATGLILFALLPVALLLHPERGRHSLAAVALVAGIGIVIVTLYLAGFQYPAGHPSPLVPVREPASYAAYVLAYLGGWLGFWSVTAAMGWGAATLGAFAIGAGWLWIRRPGDRAVVLPWLALGGYCVGSALMIGIGRAGFGPGQALASRYVTVSAVFGLCAAVLTSLAAIRRLEGLSLRRGARLGILGLAALIVTAAAGSHARSWRHATALLDGLENQVARARECLAHHEVAPDDCLRVLHSDVPRLRRFVLVLEKRGLGPFAPGRREPPLSSYTLVPAPALPGHVDAAVVDGSGQARVEGWAMDPFTRSPARSVLVVADGVVMGRAPTGVPREDVARVLGMERLVGAGWRFPFGSFRLRPGRHVMEAYAVLEDGRRIVALPGGRVLELVGETGP